jgi:two-component system OmpR family response regulator
MPRILIADDDPVSLRFLATALIQLDCEVVAIADGDDARSIPDSTAFDLLLLDRCMPDISGVELLFMLRARGIAAPAVATSAEIDARIAADLRESGFADVMQKPVSLARLESILRPYLHLPETISTITAIKSGPLLNDDTALKAIGGDAVALASLRNLLAREIAALEIELTGGDLVAQPGPLSDRLHRLRASCGFCGANALAGAAASLQQNLRSNRITGQSEISAFIHLCRDTAAALRS